MVIPECFIFGLVGLVILLMNFLLLSILVIAEIRLLSGFKFNFSLNVIFFVVKAPFSKLLEKLFKTRLGLFFWLKAVIVFLLAFNMEQSFLLFKLLLIVLF